MDTEMTAVEFKAFYIRSIADSLAHDLERLDNLSKALILAESFECQDSIAYYKERLQVASDSYSHNKERLVRNI